MNILRSRFNIQAFEKVLIAMLLRLFRLIPQELDLNTLLSDTKQQRHREADYLNEAYNTIQWSIFPVNHLISWRHCLSQYAIT
ncbi:MAG: hypothetical protein P8163_22550 [Candidatus Thiodiazotropha sp.]